MLGAGLAERLAGEASAKHVVIRDEEWIVHSVKAEASGGRAVLAHPGRYGLSAGALEDLLGEFRAAGGEAIEVVTGSHSPDQYALFAALADKHAFLASRGSDFHAPGDGNADFGKLPPLAAHLRPVWHDWQL